MSDRNDDFRDTIRDGAGDPFRQAVAAALSEGGGDPMDDQHPGVDDLISYHQGELPEAEADRVQEHLVVCGDCLIRLSELDAMVEAGVQGPPETGDVVETAAWRALRPLLRRPGRTVPLALAAAFLVAAVGLGLWALQQRAETTRLQDHLARLSRPQPAAEIVDLYSDTAVRGSSGQPGPVDLSSVDHLTVILHLPEPPDVDSFEAEILDSAGTPVWRGRVRMDELGTLSLGLPRPFLDAGLYRIVVYGASGENRERLATFPLDLASGGR